MGRKKAIYLFFNLPFYSYSHVLLKARLILFKLPSAPFDVDICAEKITAQYTLYPLLEAFSFFNYMFSPSVIDFSRRVNFENLHCRSYTEINITQIVQDWISGKMENHGLLLTGECDSPYVFYASNQYKILGMSPSIRLIFGDDVRPCSLQAVPCDVEVSGRLP